VQPRLAAIIVLLALVCIIVAVAAVRRRRLSEPLAVFWILLSAGLGGFAILASRRFIDHAAELLGILYAPSLYFLAGLVVVLGVLLYFSVQISILTRLVRGLIQDVAVRGHEVDSLRRERARSTAAREMK
jgi:hypothetical protein